MSPFKFGLMSVVRLAVAVNWTPHWERFCFKDEYAALLGTDFYIFKRQHIRYMSLKGDPDEEYNSYGLVSKETKQRLSWECAEDWLTAVDKVNLVLIEEA